MFVHYKRKRPSTSGPSRTSVNPLKSSSANNKNNSNNGTSISAINGMPMLTSVSFHNADYSGQFNEKSVATGAALVASNSFSSKDSLDEEDLEKNMQYSTGTGSISPSLLEVSPMARQHAPLEIVSDSITPDTSKYGYQPTFRFSSSSLSSSGSIDSRAVSDEAAAAVNNIIAPTSNMHQQHHRFSSQSSTFTSDSFARNLSRTLDGIAARNSVAVRSATSSSGGSNLSSPYAIPDGPIELIQSQQKPQNEIGLVSPKVSDKKASFTSIGLRESEFGFKPFSEPVVQTVDRAMVPLKYSEENDDNVEVNSVMSPSTTAIPQNSRHLTYVSMWRYVNLEEKVVQLLLIYYSLFSSTNSEFA